MDPRNFLMAVEIIYLVFAYLLLFIRNISVKGMMGLEIAKLILLGIAQCGDLSRLVRLLYPW